VKKKTPRVFDLARALVDRARQGGCLFEAELDAYLDARLDFEERVTALLAAIGDLKIEAAPAAELALDEPFVPQPRVPSMAIDDNLRRYLRQVHVLKRIEKDEEIRLAKRLEFMHRRFRATIEAAKLGQDHLRSVLGGEFSRSFASDLRLARIGEAGAPGRLAEARRRTICQRAAELNRVRGAFVERNLGVVADLAMCYRTYGIPVMDLIQEGNGALIRAVEKFDWRKDVRFQTYATFWIRQAVERCIAFNKGIVRVPNYLQQKMRRLRREGILPRRDRDVSIGDVAGAFDVKREVAGHLLETERTHYSLDVSIDEDGETFASLLADDGRGIEATPIEFATLRERIAEVLTDLTPMEREIVQLRFGLGGQPPLTLEDVGRRMNVSRERIRQLQVRAIRKLQRPGLLQRLAGFV
jgi:RNA polymerase primary sigma factor